jgi:succinyldiaminopimelate transaminase
MTGHAAIDASGYVPPPYPYDRLNELKAIAQQVPGGLVDLSIGTPFDPPPAVVLEALAQGDGAESYPASIGSLELREAACAWMERRAGASVEPHQVAATVGSKEFVAGVPHYLRLKDPSRDTVLYPAVSYPSYAMGARLAYGRAVAVPVDDQWRLRLDAIDPADAKRALCLWVNAPGNPAGGLDDLGAAAAWGREHNVPVLSDECYLEFTYSGERRSILQHGNEGVLAVHSLSKRSNFAGVRVGFYAGDAELVRYLGEVRKHGGFMVPAPSQAAAVAALNDDAHVDAQREIYRRRLQTGIEALAAIGVEAPMPGGGFYLWAPAPNGDAWAFAQHLAEVGGALVSPGEFYGEQGAGFVRVAMVQPDDRVDLMRDRLVAHS